MFNLLKQTEIVQQACQQFLDPRPCDYNFNRQITPLTTKNPHLKLQEEDVTTQLRVGGRVLENRIRLHFVSNGRNDENCIVYLHGLSSYCLQGKFLVPYLASSFSLCLYDSRSHGKNQASYVTYGLLESLELLQILRAVLKKGYKNIILWGRSMGAVTCLRALQQSNEEVMRHVKYVVADSPFATFRGIACQIISKMTSLPEILAGVLASAFSSRIAEKYAIDLDELSLEGLNTHVPVTFFHSSSDELISSKHIELITKLYSGPKDVCDIKMAHNQERPVWVILRAMSKIYAVLKEKPKKIVVEDQKKRGLSLTKFGSQKFLTVVTPSNLDTTIRKSIRIPLPSTTTRPHFPSTHNTHHLPQTKQNLDIPMPPKMKHSSIFSSSSLSTSYVKLGTPSSKIRKSMLFTPL